MKSKSNKSGLNIKRILTVLLSLILICVIGILVINAYMCAAVRNRYCTLSDVFTPAKIMDYYYLNAEYIVVPGCGIIDNTYPTPLLSDRIDVAVELYMCGFAPKLLFSGDHSSDDYNEVAVMKAYAMSLGVPEEDIVLDHEGFSTMETVYRANEEYGITRAIFVTQEYHLSRTLYLAREAGIDARGICAEGHLFNGQLYYSSREIFARAKDCLLSIFDIRISI